MANLWSRSIIAERYIEGFHRLFGGHPTLLPHHCRAALIYHLRLDEYALPLDFSTDIEVEAIFSSLKAMP